MEHRLTFPTTEEEIRKLRAGDLVTVDGHIIGIRDGEGHLVRRHRHASRSYSISPSAEMCADARRAAQHW